MPTDVKRLDGLRIGEVSGVDHPAHMEEGWLVLKAAANLSDEDMAEVIAEAQALAKAEQTDPASSTQPPSEEVAMGDNTATDLSEDMLKSLPEPVRKAILQSQEIAQSALTELRKERDQRLDVEAIAKARADYPSIPGLIPEEFGPAVRKAAEVAPEGVAEILKALASANAALAESVLLKEVGSSVAPAAGGNASNFTNSPGTDGNAFQQVQSLAKAALDKGEVDTIEQGVAKALTDNPSLYSDYLADQKGA